MYAGGCQAPTTLRQLTLACCTSEMQMAQYAMAQMLEAMKGGAVDVAIFDATNTTKERRRWVFEAVTNAKHRVLFLETICTDDTIIRSNVREAKLKSPDYQCVAGKRYRASCWTLYLTAFVIRCRGMSEEAAIEDFLKRIQHYIRVYVPVNRDMDEEDMPYIKLVDVGRRIEANLVRGHLTGRMLHFLANMHITPKTIWISRHGESEYNVKKWLGGNPGLSERGVAYSKKLAEFFTRMYARETEFTVWTSTLKRTIQTAHPLGRDSVQWKALDEIDAGLCDGMTYEQIAEAMPEEYEARQVDKFHYRYPRVCALILGKLRLHMQPS